MKFAIKHTNINVTNIETSLAFYQKALGLHEIKRKNAADGSFTIVFLSDDDEKYTLELTCLKNHPQKYDLGENENHIAFAPEDIKKAHSLHEEMGCICYENKAMGIYFIEDPDGYWLEIVNP
jgi:lactoylglutathione lyase